MVGARLTTRDSRSSYGGVQGIMQQVKTGGRVVLSSQMAMESQRQSSDDIYSKSARHLDVIEHEIQSFITQLGFTSFCYSSVPSMLGKTSAPSTHSFDLKQRADGREGFGTFSSKLLRSYYQSMAEQDPLWGELTQTSDPVIYPNAQLGSLQVQSFYSRHGIKSQLFLPMRWQTGSGWFCLFALQSDMAPETLEVQYQKLRSELNARALGWHLELMMFQQERFNPYIVRKVLSPRARHILKLAAEGYPSRAIADMTDISDNGVNYHYREAKRVLGARNRTHLVSLAKDQKII